MDNFMANRSTKWLENEKGRSEKSSLDYENFTHLGSKANSLEIIGLLELMLPMVDFLKTS